MIATANEDGNSILYVIKPGAAKKNQVIQYTYTPAPDAKGSSALHTGGGTDSVQIVNGQILVSASAPTHSGRAATFRVTLATITTRKKTKVGGTTKRVKVVTHVAKLASAFLDNSHATDAITGNGSPCTSPIPTPTRSCPRAPVICSPVTTCSTARPMISSCSPPGSAAATRR